MNLWNPYRMTALVLGVAAAGLAASASGPNAQDAPAEETLPSLQERLDEKKAAFEATAPESTKATYARGIEILDERGIVAKAKHEGDTAPDFTLPNAVGDSVTLSTLLAAGPVVLTWYRGGWCPYCNIQLRTMQEVLPAIQAAGGQLVAISPELPDKSLDTKEKNALAFHVLSDKGNAVAEDYGIVFTLPDIVVAAFEGKFDLAAYNGDDSNQLPLSATYVIAQDGTIAYAFLDTDYRNRAEPAKIIEVLNAL